LYRSYVETPLRYRPLKTAAAAAAFLASAFLASTPHAARAQAQSGSPDEALMQAVETANVPTAATVAAAPRPTSLPPKQLQWVFNATESRAVRCTVFSAALRDSYGPAKAGDGRGLLVLDVELENIIPLTVIYEKKVPTEYQVPNLADHLYLVIDGARVARLRPDADELPGHVKVKAFKLPRIGERARANLVFDVPMAEAKTVELRYYDFAHGHMALPLVGTDAAFAAQKQLKAVAPAVKNEVVEAAVFGVQKAAEFAGQKAPQGMTFVVADLRARSMFTFDGDATAFDPKAKPGAKMKIGTVADWTEAHRYLQLVVDGERAYSPIVPGTQLSDAPRFLPDVFTGGQAVFLAPVDAKSLELRCDFPNAKPPGGAANFRPKGLTLALEGERPSPPKRSAIVSVDDDVYKLAVVGQSVSDTFAGAKAPEGKRFLVLDVSVSNVGRQGELFQTKPQLKCATSDGAQLEVDPATFEGKYRPTELVFIPAGERRTFQVAYSIPAGETRPRLAYGGISLAKSLDLQPIAAAPGAIAAANPAPAPNAPVKPQPAKPQPVAPAKPQVAVNVPAAPHTPAPAAEKPLKQAQADVLRVPAKQPHEPKGLAGAGLTPEQINKAIDRGAEFLWNEIRTKEMTSNYPYGYRQEHMPAALALVHADAHKKFPDFDATVRKYIATFDPTGNRGTYMVGIYCMLIEAYGDPTYLPQMRKATQWLLDTQGPDGTWGYGLPIKEAKEEVPIRRVLQVAGGRQPDEPAGGTPLARRTEWDKGADGDTSVTQYALLGLHAASRFGVKIPKEVWERTLKEHRKRQDEKTGGFGYTYGGAGSNYGSMTCAGICALALARFEAGEKDFAVDEDIENGLAWMAKHFTVEGNPHPAYDDPKALGNEWHYYYLYSLERVGRILGTEFIGSHEWYPVGAKYLLSKQRAEDGGWLSKQDKDDPILSTSFALLFLTRATASLELPKRDGPGTLMTTVVTPPGQKVYIILDCSGTMIEANNGTPRFEVARAAMARLAGEMAPTSQVGLRVFGATKTALQQGADEDTVLLAPLSKEGREQAIAALQKIRPRGKTPLARTLIAAAADVKGEGTAEDPVTVILVSDGGEDNTRPPKDPLVAAAELGKDPGVRWFVIGFDVNRPEWTKQLDGLARSGGGQYLAAEDGAALHREMRSAILGTPESFQVVDTQGRPVRGGEFGQTVTLPEGQYKFRTTFAGHAFEQPFWINAGTTTAVSFDAAAVAAALAAGEGTPAPSAAPAAAAAAAPTGATQPVAPAPAGKFCTSCGGPLTPAAKFCTKCGAAAK
jgi:hypothetical protein